MLDNFSLYSLIIVVILVASLPFIILISMSFEDQTRVTPCTDLEVIENGAERQPIIVSTVEEVCNSPSEVVDIFSTIDGSHICKGYYTDIVIDEADVVTINLSRPIKILKGYT